MSSNPYKPVWFIFIVILALIAVTAGSRFFGPKEIIPWRSDLSAAKVEAASGNKPILAYFTASWCGPCEGMKRTTWADRDVEQALRAYVPVKIDIDQQRDIAVEFAHYAQTDGVPFYVILGADGQPNRSAEGAMDSQTFMRWLKAGR